MLFMKKTTSISSVILWMVFKKMFCSGSKRVCLIGTFMVFGDVLKLLNLKTILN